MGSQRGLTSVIQNSLIVRRGSNCCRKLEGTRRIWRRGGSTLVEWWSPASKTAWRMWQASCGMPSRHAALCTSTHYSGQARTHYPGQANTSTPLQFSMRLHAFIASTFQTSNAAIRDCCTTSATLESGDHNSWLWFVGLACACIVVLAAWATLPAT